MMRKVLTIAGSDCSGGAGIQADIKTIAAHRMYGMSVITALTAQNTTGVYGVEETSPAFVAKQIDCIFSDIRPDGVKIGMVSTSSIINVIAEKLVEHKAENIVVDPVMVSTSGSRLLSKEAMDALVTNLLPLGTVITPNIPEAEALCGFSIGGKADMERAAAAITRAVRSAQDGKLVRDRELGILIKGGHLAADTADDLLYQNGSARWFTAPYINTINTHGTGCTLSSAIACGLASGKTMAVSVGEAKKYISIAIGAGLDLGAGCGPLDHTYSIVG